jgi:hypothetical protein
VSICQLVGLILRTALTYVFLPHMLPIFLGIVLKTINNEIYNLNVPIDLPIPELKQMVRVRRPNNIFLSTFLNDFFIFFSFVSRNQLPFPKRDKDSSIVAMSYKIKVSSMTIRLKTDIRFIWLPDHQIMMN